MKLSLKDIYGKLMSNDALAEVLSALVPGIGQLYNGRLLTGILWLIITPGF
jgi:TM2 domain-containing membrane protein YozV